MIGLKTLHMCPVSGRGISGISAPRRRHRAQTPASVFDHRDRPADIGRRVVRLDGNEDLVIGINNG